MQRQWGEVSWLRPLGDVIALCLAIKTLDDAMTAAAAAITVIRRHRVHERRETQARGTRCPTHLTRQPDVHQRVRGRDQSILQFGNAFRSSSTSSLGTCEYLKCMRSTLFSLASGDASRTFE